MTFKSYVIVPALRACDSFKKSVYAQVKCYEAL